MKAHEDWLHRDGSGKKDQLVEDRGMNAAEQTFLAIFFSASTGRVDNYAL